MLDFTTRGWNQTSKIICGFSIIAMLVGAGFAIHRISFLNEAIVANATIVKMVESMSGDGKLQYTTVHVFADEKGNEVKVISTGANQPPVGKIGDQIELLYLTKDPDNAIRNHFFTKWGPAVIISGIGFLYFIVFAVVAHITDKRIQRELPGHPVAA